MFKLQFVVAPKVLRSGKFLIHPNLWLCSRCQTPSRSPPKEKLPSPLFPSPILILLLMGKQLFPPRTPSLTRKIADPIPLLSPPPPLLGRPLLPQPPHFTIQAPLIGRLTDLLSIPTSPLPHLFHPHHHFLLFVPLPPVLTHLPLHHQISPIFCLFLPSLIWELTTHHLLLLPLPLLRPKTAPVPFYSSTVMISYTACRNYLPSPLEKHPYSMYTGIQT